MQLPWNADDNVSRSIVQPAATPINKLLGEEVSTPDEVWRSGH